MGKGIGLEPQEVASACRFGVALMGDGRIGPGWAQVNVDTLFVRDGDFLYDLAKQMVREGEDVLVRWLELRRDNALADNENAARRRLRSEAVVVASEVVDLCRHIERNYPRRWAVFSKMLKKQTVRKIMRGVAVKDRMLAKEDIGWCAAFIVRGVGEDRLEKLLTLRSEMA